jgi:hypothetical protein
MYISDGKMGQILRGVEVMLIEHYNGRIMSITDNVTK